MDRKFLKKQKLLRLCLSIDHTGKKDNSRFSKKRVFVLISNRSVLKFVLSTIMVGIQSNRCSISYNKKMIDIYKFESN